MSVFPAEVSKVSISVGSTTGPAVMLRKNQVVKAGPSVVQGFIGKKQHCGIE
jgi:hypothetical protein